MRIASGARTTEVQASASASASVASFQIRRAAGSPATISSATSLAPATGRPEAAAYRRAIAAADASASTQPRPPHEHGSPWPTSTWPSSPA